MQPITYSLIFNLTTLILGALLAFVFEAPWLIIVILLLQNHALERFRSEANDDDDGPQPMGFTADIK